MDMPDGEGWLYRPVVGGMCKLESLHDGTLDLAAIAKANFALDCVEENRRRAEEAK